MSRFQGSTPIAPRTTQVSGRSPAPSIRSICIGAVVVCISIIQLTIYQAKTACRSPVRAAAPFNMTIDAIDALSDGACYRLDLQGSINPNAFATVLIAPDRQLWLAYDTAPIARRYVDAVVRSYRQHSDAVNFVVVALDCPILDLAGRLGLATIRPQSGTDVGDLTYNHAFTLIGKYAETEVVGFALDDVIFGSGLAPTLQGLRRGHRRHQWKDFFAVAGSSDLTDLQDRLMSMEDSDTFLEFARFRAVPGLDISADAFFWNKDWSGRWKDQPPFLFGGIGFDNWMMGWASRRKNTAVVDLSPTMELFRVERRFDLAGDEPYRVESMLNSGVFKAHGQRGQCDRTRLPWRSALDRSIFDEGVVEIIQSPPKPVHSTTASKKASTELATPLNKTQVKGARRRIRSELAIELGSTNTSPYRAEGTIESNSSRALPRSIKRT